MAASSGRRGRPWRRVKEQVLRDCAHMCHICGHGDAIYVDHVIARDEWVALGGDPEDPLNLRPAHGALNRCGVCGRCCNESKGNRRHVAAVRGSRDW